MRRTGKLHSLTLVSVSLGVIASVSVSSWNQYVGVPSMDGFDLSRFWLWNRKYDHDNTDCKPSRFSVIPVGCFFLPNVRLQAMIANVANEDITVATGITYLFRTAGQVLGVSLNRGASSRHSYETASEADHRTRSFRGSAHFLSSLPPVHLTLEPYHRRSSNRFATVQR